MLEYMKNEMGIQEKSNLENALTFNAQTDAMAGDALVELGDLSAGNMDAMCEVAEVAAGNMDAIVELAATVAALEERITTLETAMNNTPHS